MAHPCKMISHHFKKAAAKQHAARIRKQGSRARVRKVRSGYEVLRCGYRKTR